MSNLFLPNLWQSCKDSKVNTCFMVINDLSDDKLSQIINVTFDPVKRVQQREITEERTLFIKNQNIDGGMLQYFSPRKIYFPVKGAVRLMTETEVHTIDPYIDSSWKPYQDIWDYQKGFRIVGYENILFVSLWSDVNILENYDVSIKEVQNGSYQEIIENGTILFVYPDITVGNSYPYYFINTIPESSTSQLEYTGNPVNISTPHTVYLVKLTPKQQ